MDRSGDLQRSELDAAPITAVVDEASPAGRHGIYYVVTAAMLLDPGQVTQALGEVIPPGRKRPFHWAVEGPHARGRMMQLIEDLGVVAHVCVHYPTGRRGQEAARRSALQELVPAVVAEGAEELIIESRSAREDLRDRQSMIEALHGSTSALRYRWATKEEPLLWIADAVCGVVKEYLLAENQVPFERLRAAKVFDELRYRRP